MAPGGAEQHFYITPGGAEQRQHLLLADQRPLGLVLAAQLTKGCNLVWFATGSGSGASPQQRFQHLAPSTPDTNLGWLHLADLANITSRWLVTPERCCMLVVLLPALLHGDH